MASLLVRFLCPGGIWGGPLSKSETRNPKAEANPKIATRRIHFFRISDFFRISGLGFRTLRGSDLHNRLQLRTVGTQWHEHVVEYVIAHMPAQRYAFGLVKFPMDAEIDAALAVLFLGLGQRGEASRKQRTDIASIVPRDSVELVGNESKGDVISAIKPAQSLKEGAAEAGVTRGIGWEWRGKVRSCEIAGRCSQRCPVWVSDRVWIAITSARRAGARIGFADA